MKPIRVIRGVQNIYQVLSDNLKLASYPGYIGTSIRYELEEHATCGYAADAMVRYSIDKEENENNFLVLVTDMESAVLLQHAITSDKGSLYFSPIEGFYPYHITDFLTKHESLLRRAGLNVISEGRPDVVVNMADRETVKFLTGLPMKAYRLIKNPKLGWETKRLSNKELMADFQEEYFRVSAEDRAHHLLTNDVDRVVDREQLRKDLRSGHIWEARYKNTTIPMYIGDAYTTYRTTLHGEVLAYTVTATHQGETYWLSVTAKHSGFGKLRDKLNVVYGVLTELIFDVLIPSGVTKLNLGLQTPYKVTDLSTDIQWAPGLSGNLIGLGE